MFISECDANYALIQAIKDPKHSEALREFIHEEIVSLIPEYNDNHPLVMAYSKQNEKTSNQCMKWEAAYKQAQEEIKVLQDKYMADMNNIRDKHSAELNDIKDKHSAELNNIKDNHSADPPSRQSTLRHYRQSFTGV